MTSTNQTRMRPLLLAATALAGLAFGATLVTATQAEARSASQLQREAKEPHKSVNRHKIIKPLDPAAGDGQDDRAPPRIRDFRKRIDRVPARPGKAHADRVPARPGKPLKAEPRIRDFRDKRPGH